MPMAWIEPEVFFAYKGVTIYHVYKDDHLESGTREYWFTLDITLGEGTSAEFDVRGLATWDAGYAYHNADLLGASLKAIRAAIDQDLLELPWDVQKSVECKVDVNGLQLFCETQEQELRERIADCVTQFANYEDIEENKTGWLADLFD